jgi:hypothetical protein
MIGSGSATGNMSANQRLSRERADAPEPVINQYLVNVLHELVCVLEWSAARTQGAYCAHSQKTICPES